MQYGTKFENEIKVANTDFLLNTLMPTCHNQVKHGETEQKIARPNEVFKLYDDK